MGGWPANWEIIISQRFSYKSESSWPRQALSTGGLASGGAPWALGFEGLLALIAGTPQDQGRQIPLLEDSHKVSCAPGPRGESSDSTGARTRPTYWSWWVSWASRGWLDCTVDKTQVAEVNLKKNCNHIKHLFQPQHNTLLNNQWITEEIKEEIQNIPRDKWKQKTTLQNLCKASLRGKIITAQSYLRKQEKSQINNLTPNATRERTNKTQS